MNVFILTEAGESSGYGHLMRCKALGDELIARGATVEYIIAGENILTQLPNCRVMNWIKAEDFDYLDGKYCIIDSYLASEDLVGRLCLKSKRCLCIDDNNCRKYLNCLVVNPASHAKSMKYEASASTEFLLGKEYVILREAFRKKFSKNVKTGITEITITLGGTDVLGLVPDILSALSNRKIKKNVVISKKAKYYNDLNRIKTEDTFIYTDLNAEGMMKIIVKSDVVISAGGQTVNELVQCRTPGIFICAAENQRNNLSYAINNGFGVEVDASNAGVLISEALDKMDYTARLNTVKCMEKFDYSCGVKNIIDRFTI